MAVLENLKNDPQCAHVVDEALIAKIHGSRAAYLQHLQGRFVRGEHLGLGELLCLRWLLDWWLNSHGAPPSSDDTLPPHLQIVAGSNTATDGGRGPSSTAAIAGKPSEQSKRPREILVTPPSALPPTFLDQLREIIRRLIIRKKRREAELEKELNKTRNGNER